MSADDLQKSCAPVVTMGQLGDNIKKIAIDGNTTLGSDDVAYPCGLIAKYMFTDAYALYESTTRIEIDETNIAHSVDRNYKFKMPSDANATSKMWLNTTNGTSI